MKTISRALIDALLTQYTNALGEIKEGEATLEQQELVLSILDYISFQTNRYMLFPPVPLTIEKGK